MTVVRDINLGYDEKPRRSGLYVVYTNPDDLREFKYAERRLLVWDGRGWSYRMSDQRFRGHVYQWLGPLPALKLED